MQSYHVAIMENMVCMVCDVRILAVSAAKGMVYSHPVRISAGASIRACNGLPAGLREGHEPYRRLATLAMREFLATRSPHLAAAVPVVTRALRLALQTYEPHLVGHALLMLQR
jgi:hypothetical protein